MFLLIHALTKPLVKLEDERVILSNLFMVI